MRGIGIINLRAIMSLTLLFVFTLIGIGISNSEACNYLSDDFSTNTAKWTLRNGTWSIKNNKLNVTNITSGKLSYAEATIAPQGAFVIDVEMEQVYLTPSNGASGVYFFTEGTSYVNISGNSYDGFAIFVFSGGSITIDGYNVAKQQWDIIKTHTASGIRSIGFEVLSSGVALRINGQNTNVTISATINNPSVFKKIWLTAQGEASLFTRGTEVNFDNVCVKESASSVRSCTSTLDTNLRVNVPIVKYKDALFGEMFLWLNLQYQFNPNSLLFKLIDYGMMNSSEASSYQCAMSTIGSDLSIRLSDLAIDKSSFWLNLKFDTNLSRGSDLYFQGSNYGLNIGSISGGEHLTLISPLDASTNQPITTTFRWTATGTPTAYRLYVANDFNTLLNIDLSGTTCSGCVINERITGVNTYTPASGLLQSGNTYYWMVKAAYSSNMIASPIWAFTIGGGGSGGGTTTTIGPTGGTINYEGSIITVQPGTFINNTPVTVSKGVSNQPPKDYPDAVTVSDLYTFSFAGDTFKEISIQLSTKISVSPSDEVLAVIESDDYYNMFGSSPLNKGLIYDVISKGNNSYTINIPYSAVRASSATSNFTEIKAGSKQRTFTIRLVSGYVTLTSDHFRLRYPKNTCSLDVVKYYLSYAEKAYEKLITQMRFSPNGLTWPMPINIVTLDASRYGEAGYARFGRFIWGTGSLHINLNKSFCKSNSATDMREMRVTMGHEFFHTIQYVYDPHWALTESHPWLGSEYAWFYDASSTWFENLMLEDDSYVSSAVNSSNAKFYKNGLEVGGQADPQGHGYGSSRFLRYLTLKDNSRKDIILKTWAGIRDSSIDLSATAHLFGALLSYNEGLQFKWEKFAEEYIMGKTGFAGWQALDMDDYFSYQKQSVSKNFPLTMYPYSAYNIVLAYAQLEQDIDYKIAFSGTNIEKVITAKLYNGTTGAKISEVETYTTKPFTFKAKKGDKLNLIVVDYDAYINNSSSKVNITVAPVVYIASIDPVKGPVDTLVTIKGEGFGKSTDTRTVFFNGIKATTVTWKSETELTAKVPQNASTGDVVVEVNSMRSNGKNFEVIAQCNTTQVAGADTPDTRTIELGKPSGTFKITYETFSQKDQIIVSYEGKVLHDSGCVGTNGNRTVTLNYSGQSTQITVQVVPNCAGGSGTQWNYSVQCP